MTGLLALSRAIDRFTAFIGKAVGWLILVSILISATNAVIRKVFSVSSNAWLEAQWYLYGAAFLLAAAYTLQQNEAYPHRHHLWLVQTPHPTLDRPARAHLLPHALRGFDDLLFCPYFLLSYRTGEVSTNAAG
jgi:TRAP-type mannitol/chloroaromatic compound transport system permease small subunit